MRHRTLAVIDFLITPPATFEFLVHTQLGSSETLDPEIEGWDLAVELVFSRESGSRSLPQSSLGFIEFVSEDAPAHELSIGAKFDLYYGFKRVASARVINVMGSSVPAGRVRSTKSATSVVNGAPVVYPAGTEMVLVEALDEKCTEWLVEVRIPDETLVGGASYDVVEVALADTEPVPQGTS